LETNLAAILQLFNLPNLRRRKGEKIIRAFEQVSRREENEHGNDFREADKGIFHQKLTRGERIDFPPHNTYENKIPLREILVAMNILKMEAEKYVFRECIKRAVFGLNLAPVAAAVGATPTWRPLFAKHDARKSSRAKSKVFLPFIPQLCCCFCTRQIHNADF